jgi:outer membrane receptor protein involved in Fe transport
MFSSIRWRLACLAAVAAIASALAATTPAPTVLAPEIVTATRTPQTPAFVAATARSFDEVALQETPALTLDGVLRSVPGFSLFRRSDSFTANPTAQGVSLRGLGPSGASRSLVLLDGVPLNDPFGGWIAWTKVPRATLARVEVVPGGGATAWGNAALGGVIQVLTSTPALQTTHVTAVAGDYGTRSIEVSHTQPVGSGKLDFAARAFGTDGFSLVAPDRRGPIDTAAWSRHRWINARWRQPLTTELEFAATFRTYEEKRGNGTPYQRNGTREKFLSLALAGQSAGTFAWNATMYGQDQSFASTFSGVNATRTAETPASDQFAVPATAVGGAWTGTWKQANGARTSVGADARATRGETRENFTFVAGNFTRLRVAGGRQAVAGVFALHEQPLTPSLRSTLGARLDTWRDTDGHRRESDRATGVLLRNDRYADHRGTEFSPSAGLVWLAAPSWRIRANAQHAFRRPTLNELYRPFRVGANVTEANPDLRTEHVTSGEVGAEWTALASNTAAAPSPLLLLSATAYWNELRDAVGNVTIARGPGTFPIVGTIAAGGVGRQRLNLDRTRVQGLELSARWTPTEALTLTADALYNDAEVRRAPVARALVGNRVAQVPRRSASLSASWRAPHEFVVTPRVRYIGRQFEDDENQLALGAVVVADLGVSHAFTKGLELFLTCENIGNARIETGRSTDGIVNIGTPRLVVGGVRGTW